MRLILALCLSALVASNAGAASFKAEELLKKDDSWYRSAEGKRAVENILSNQSPLGDWPKNFDTSAAPSKVERSKIKGTFDNGATVGEIRVLARAFGVTGDERCREAALKGLDHILTAQYETGGWPQYSPPGKGYPRYITFNDNTFVNLMELVSDISRQAPDWGFVGKERVDRCAKAFAAGIDCVLKAQVKVDGKLSVWCAQHDEKTLEPRPARAFELVSLSGGESARILRLLMQRAERTPAVEAAVDAGVAWYEKVAVRGIKVVSKNGDKVVESAADAPPLWARFYEIGTNRPFFCGRDGVKKYSLAEIEKERRTGYAWYGNWGETPAREYRKWKRK